MAFLFQESSNMSVVQSAVKALKLVFFSAGLISTVLMVKGAFMPFFFEILLPNLVALWNSFRYFLSSPLYICIIINAVVLLIAATSSSFHHHHDDHEVHDYHPPPPTWVEAPPPETVLLPQPTNDDTASTNLYQLGCDNIEDVTSTTQASTTFDPPQLQDDVIEETPADSLSRDEGESDETMESTWQAIVAGKTKKVLTKSESVPPRSRVEEDPQQHSSTAAATRKELRKLETFNDRASIRRLGGLRRDPSVGVDEFNQQVEAFINKFNRDIRLQRQESDQRFLDMINRGL